MRKNNTTTALPQLPSWYPNDAPEGIAPVPPSTIAPKFTAGLMEELPKFLASWIYAPESSSGATYDVCSLVMIAHADDDATTMETISDVERIVADRFAAIVQTSPIWQQLRDEFTAALIRAMTPDRLT